MTPKRKGRRPNDTRDKLVYTKYRNPEVVATKLAEESGMSRNNLYKLVKRVEVRFPELKADMDEKYEKLWKEQNEETK